MAPHTRRRNILIAKGSGDDRYRRVVLVEPGGRNAGHEAIGIEWKSGAANGLRLFRQEGVECRAVENVQRSGSDAAFLWSEPRRREAARREAGGNGFRAEQQELFERAQRQVTDRLGWTYAIQVPQHCLPIVVGEGGGASPSAARPE